MFIAFDVIPTIKGIWLTPNGHILSPMNPWMSVVQDNRSSLTILIWPKVFLIECWWNSHCLPIFFWSSYCCDNQYYEFSLHIGFPLAMFSWTTSLWAVLSLETGCMFYTFLSWTVFLAFTLLFPTLKLAKIKLYRFTLLVHHFLL